MSEQQDFKAIIAEVVERHRRADGTVPAAVKQALDAIRQALEAKVAAAREEAEQADRVYLIFNAWTEAQRKKGRDEKELTWGNCVRELGQPLAEVREALRACAMAAVVLARANGDPKKRLTDVVSQKWN